MKKKESGKRIKVRVKATSDIYIGTIFVPNSKDRLSDLLNDSERGEFINLTNVYVNEIHEKMDFVCINKHMIEFVEPFEE